MSTCTCLEGYTGDPNTKCTPMVPQGKPQEPSTEAASTPTINPCNPSPCGSGAICQENQGAALCQCPKGFIGNPHDACHPGCSVDSDCPSDKACQAEKCVDPCQESCGLNAECNVRNHMSTCTCPEGYTGDPVVQCALELQEPSTEAASTTPCNPSPCGSDAICQENRGAATCHCPQNFIGDPNVACYPGCWTDSACPSDKACRSNECVDPCKGSCANSAECTVKDHEAICTCPVGYTGNPYKACYLSHFSFQF